MDYVGLAQSLAPVLAAYAANAAKGRADTAGLTAANDRTATSDYQAAQNAQFDNAELDLQRKAFDQSSRGTNAKQAAIGDLLAHFSPTSVRVPGIQSATISGGLQNGLGLLGRAGAADLSRQALLAELQGNQYPAVPMLTPPTPTALPQASTFDTLAGAAGTGLSAYAAVAPYLQQLQKLRSQAGGVSSPSVYTNLTFGG